MSIDCDQTNTSFDDEVCRQQFDTCIPSHRTTSRPIAGKTLDRGNFSICSPEWGPALQPRARQTVDDYWDVNRKTSTSRLRINQFSDFSTERRNKPAWKLQRTTTPRGSSDLTTLRIVICRSPSHSRNSIRNCNKPAGIVSSTFRAVF